MAGRPKIVDGSILKNFSLRMPSELWDFLRLHSFTTGEPMGATVVKCLAKYKARLDKKNNT